MDELYFEEYKKILVEEVADPTLPIVANVNIGHATPRCIIPFGVDAVVDANRQQITFSMRTNKGEPYGKKQITDQGSD